jgi:hypothetical protein
MGPYFTTAFIYGPSLLSAKGTRLGHILLLISHKYVLILEVYSEEDTPIFHYLVAMNNSIKLRLSGLSLHVVV